MTIADEHLKEKHSMQSPNFPQVESDDTYDRDRYERVKFLIMAADSRDDTELAAQLHDLLIVRIENLTVGAIVTGLLPRRHIQ